MANLCEVCGKFTSSGMNVSHSHIRTRKTWKPNIQREYELLSTVLLKKVNVCTRCLRS
ncbi:MAG: 50S ribosomal protein L28 [Veillonella sp.]|nr:50S ribosomal protein L28 [Veillonella sp.]